MPDKRQMSRCHTKLTNNPKNVKIAYVTSYKCHTVTLSHCHTVTSKKPKNPKKAKITFVTSASHSVTLSHQKT
jgi:hypothetical protein